MNKIPKKSYFICKGFKVIKSIELSTNCPFPKEMRQKIDSCCKQMVLKHNSCFYISRFSNTLSYILRKISISMSKGLPTEEHRFLVIDVYCCWSAAFSSIRRLLKNYTIIPHSEAVLERIFSKMVKAVGWWGKS